MLTEYCLPSVISNSNAFAEMKAHAQSNPSEEMLGLMAFTPGGGVEVRVFKNLALSPEDRFSGDSQALGQAHTWQRQGKRLIICHSHPPKHPKHFSAGDIHTLHQWNAAGLLLCGENFGETVWYNPLEKPPLVGRPWRPVESNCYTLVRDALKFRGFDLDLAVVNAAREIGAQFDSIFDLSLSVQRMQAYNISQKVMPPVGIRQSWFAPGTMQEGDVLIFTGGRGWATHLGVMGAPETNQFLHHLENGLSAWENFDENWRKSLCGVHRIPSPVHNGAARRTADRVR